jgi:N-acyl homoserine lactone hydrolase
MANHELYLIQLGQLGVQDEATGEAAFNQVPGYLIRSASGRTIMVDSGIPAAAIGQETAAPWWDLLNATAPEDDIVPRLAELSLTPADVDLLVSTHFDFDHCGRHDAFAAAGITSVVQRRHLEDARENQRYDRALWDLPGIDYIPLDGDTELEPGLRLLATSGHALGHQSVFVETTGGPVILAIDAISRGEELETGEIPEWWPDPATARQSRDKLLALAAATGAAIICGHDARQWATLPKSPRPYRRS